MMKINTFLYTLVFLSAQLCGMERMPIDQALASIMANRDRIMGQKKDWLQPPVGRVPQTIDGLPHYYMKHDGASRVMGASILRDCIQEYKLDIIVPEKAAFDLGPYKDLCLCEHIQGKRLADGDTINARQVADLLTVITKAKQSYRDIHQGNLIVTKDDKIAIIDTAMDGFGDGSAWLGLQKIGRCCQLDGDAHELLAAAICEEFHKIIAKLKTLT